MTPRLITERTALLPPRLFASVQWFAVASRYARIAVDYGMRYDKNIKDVHRYTIADTRGELRLTVPVSRPKGAFALGNLIWDKVLVSGHGRWWEVHITALDSAYGRTPFYEFYRHKFMPLLHEPSPGNPEPITSLISRANALLLPILTYDTREVPYTPGLDYDDYRHTDLEKIVSIPPYWQIRRETLGFIPNLSALDILFNIGPESALHIN